MTRPSYITLHTLTQQISQVISSGFKNREFLVLADITNLSVYASKNQYYFELIEKDEETGEIIAKVQATAFGRACTEIRNFEEITGQKLRNDLKLLMSVQVNYHGIHGLKLNLLKIDPEYTLGSIERERRLTLARLVQENPETIKLLNGEYLSRNKELYAPQAFRHLAIISSSNSAGFQDLMHSLNNNDFGYSFQCDPYFTGVQGEHNSSLMVQKLIEVYRSEKKYDAVIIVRGGGSSSDLLMFNSYDLARAVARFPVPVITGIGHQRNETIVDLMAFAYTKTPTKAAEFIIAHNHAFESRVKELHRLVFVHARQILHLNASSLKQTGHSFIHASVKLLSDQRSFLVSRAGMLPAKSGAILFQASSMLGTLQRLIVSSVRIMDLRRKGELELIITRLHFSVPAIFKVQEGYLGHYKKLFFLMSTEQTLKRGFALVKISGRPVTDISMIRLKDTIEIELHDSILEADITKLKNTTR